MKMGAPVKILCILLLLLHKSQQQQTFNDQEKLNLPANYNTGWMAALDDETLLSNITIPGTHDTMARYWGPAAECQSWSLEDQLKAGIRYLDLRVSGVKLAIMHGPLYQFTTLPKALQTIKDFLSKYKTETVLVRVKPVSPFSSKVPNLVKNLIKEESPESWVVEKIPKISEVRKKVVFVQKDIFTLGIPLYETHKKGEHKVTNIDQKKQTIIACLKEASAASKDGKVALSYSSGTGWPKLKLKYTPKNVAKEINPWLYQYLQNQYSKNNPKPCFGIIAMDFPGLDLIRKVIEFNKKVFNSP